ncbi:heparan-alpha-glucosaminide N-acetyltransferase [Ligaoa zhengdingensis]|uniref:heparan-alpha-glucosaminide N-acetyltransferase n=1 Tax=Ligaoa zhengdingensis TaxID=2763658 RepID=UPI0031BA25E9
MAEKRDLSGRVWLVDELRGAFILLMVVYHTFYDLVYIFDVNIPAFRWAFTTWIQLLIAGLFVFLSGVASRFSRNNLKRGAQCFALGMLMTLVTAVVLPEQIVLFGVLHMLGVCMMLFPLMRPLLDRIPPWAGVIGCAALFFLTFNTQLGFWGMRGWEMALPSSWYGTSWLFWLGFPRRGFWSSDYFPLLPWIFWFLGGAFAGVPIKARRAPAWFYRPHCRWLAALGRNTIYIYLLHQPVIYGALSLLFALLRR